VDAGTIHLDGELTIYRAQELQQVLRTTLEAAADGAALRVDLSAVSEIDSAGVQVLIAARHSATAGGRSLQVEGVSPAVQEVVDLMGLAALLGLRQSAAGQP
jgi:anti-anti-sigma factor